jgi:hypothetical protein
VKFEEIFPKREDILCICSLRYMLSLLINDNSAASLKTDGILPGELELWPGGKGMKTGCIRVNCKN